VLFIEIPQFRPCSCMMHHITAQKCCAYVSLKDFHMGMHEINGWLTFVQREKVLEFPRKKKPVLSSNTGHHPSASKLEVQDPKNC